MPSNAPWARYDPRIRLVIDDFEVPCIRCSIDYELNAIPQATATLAVGRDFKGEMSPTHELAADFVNRAPAQIYITPNALGKPIRSEMKPGELGLAGDEVRIFDGFVTAAGFGRSRGSAQFTIQMEHWLSELGFSSIFSKSSHPTSPGQFSFGALGPMGGAGAFTNLGLAFNFVTSETIAKDFWGAALKPFLTELCKKDAFFAWDPLIEGKGANDSALAAIKRFDSPYQTVLALDIEEANADIVSNIMNHVSTAVGTPGPLANQTLWDVLIGTLASEYLFSIVPRVEDAVVAPFIPGYRKSYATIIADTETQVEWTRGLGRPLRGVGILAGAEFSAGSQFPGQAAPPGMGIGGYYTPDKEAKGIIMIKKGPDWVSRLYSAALYGHESTGVSTGKAIGTAVSPGGDKTEPPDPKKKIVPDEIAKRLKKTVRPFLDKFAQAHYALEKLRTRQAVCSCPFRLDIAPGSTVKVENAGEQHIAGDPFRAPFFAHVGRVSLAIDAEQPMIGTSFHLSHIRSEKENKLDTMSVEKHPLYKSTFSGCPLIDLDV